MSGRAGYLLDTNILSETRKKKPDAGVMAFLHSVDASAMYLSVLTLGEFRKGVEAKRGNDAEAAERLAGWVDGLEAGFADRILDIDLAVARLWGEWCADRSRSTVDTLLAATSVRNDLTLVTRNVCDVEGLPLTVLNPWQK